MRKLTAFALLAALLRPLPVAAAPALLSPVDGPVALRYSAQGAHGPGHRGIDLSVPEGTRVRAAAPGVVAFAGRVAWFHAVSVEHPGGAVTTYSSLSEIWVRTGERVTPASVLGLSGRAHPGGAPGLHLSLRVDGVYLDPQRFWAPSPAGGAIRLIPVEQALLPERFSPSCDDRPARAPSGQLAPNDNVAIAIAGLGSSTSRGVRAAMYERGPELLGYPRDRIYRFSYAGIDAGDLHVPYGASRTFTGVDRAAARLAAMLRAVARRHPGARVDLLAHSQGGLVARRFLTRYAGEPGLPYVEHLVTFATPHSGAPVAGAARTIASTRTGAVLLGTVERSAGGHLPSPAEASMADLAPGSPLMEELARRALRTRVLTVGIANDFVVPADRASLPGHPGRTIGPRWFSGHDLVVGAPEALHAAWSFLAGAQPPCPSLWDQMGPWLGRVLSLGEGLLGPAYRALETVSGLGALSAAVSQAPGRG